MKLRNPFTQAGRWFKANLHTHSTTSDGRQSPAETAEAYRTAGYDVLAMTDHSKTNDVRGLSRKNFLVISGMEYHPRCPATPNPHHLVALNVPHGFGFQEPYPEDGNACIQAVKAAGGESILAHPLWCGHRYDMYAYLDGIIGLAFGLYVCSHPAANAVSMLFFERQSLRQVSSGWSAVQWLALNLLTLLAGWMVVFIGITRLVDGTA